jgi:hypothetical protein
MSCVKREFADAIATVVLDKFKELPSRGKPRENEWTVIAGIVLVDEDEKNVLSIAYVFVFRL